MIDKIISALESMQEDMEEHGELQKARGVSSAIWLIEIMRDWADRKTESNSEMPNNCEPQTTYYCDTCNHKGCENCVADGSNPYCVPSQYEPKPQTIRCPNCTYNKDEEADCNKCLGKNCSFSECPMETEPQIKQSEEFKQFIGHDCNKCRWSKCGEACAIPCCDFEPKDEPQGDILIPLEHTGFAPPIKQTERGM